LDDQQLYGETQSALSTTLLLWKRALAGEVDQTDALSDIREGAGPMDID
jgi:hypothetical protein